MYSPSLDFLKSPIENVANLLGGAPQDHEKALKHAFYNALAMLLLMLALSAGWAVYIVLEPFFKPLLWALLCGSVLYPIKYSLATSMLTWLNGLSTNSTPLLLGIMMIPVQALHEASERIGNMAKRYIMYIGGLVFFTFLAHVIYQYTPYICVQIIYQIGTFGNSLILWVMKLCGGYMTLTAVVGYIVVVICFWTPNASQHFMLAASLLWFMISLFLGRLASSFQVTVFFGLQFLLALGFGYEVWLLQKRITCSGKKASFLDTFFAVIQGIPEDDMIEGDVFSLENQNFEAEEKIENIDGRKEVQSLTNDEAAGTSKIQSGVSFSAGTLTNSPDVGKNINKDREDLKLHRNRKRPAQLCERASSTCYPRRTTSLPDTSFQKEVIAAIHQRQRSRAQSGLRREKIHDECSESTKYLYGLVWACVILSMWTYTWLLHAVFVLLLLYIVKHTGHYFHIWQMLDEQYKSMVGSPQNWYESRQKAFFPLPLLGLFKLLSCLNDMAVEMLKASVNMACCTVVILGVNTAIISTIVFFTVQVHHWLKDVDPEKAAQLEKQVVELWDRVYQAWMTSGTAEIGPKVTSSAIYASWDSIMDGVRKTPELLNKAGIMAFLKENVGTLLTVFDSLWIILKGNLTLCVDSVMALVMVLFGSGTAVINFFLNLFVFFTALFYLLASSSDMYKPVDLITKISPNSGNRFAVALENATASVFLASLKRAIISGLCTWLVHSVFQVRLVYIPSVLAALLGAIPFMGAYWASLPAVLELYFQDYVFFAVLLAAIQILAVQAVDTAVYKEIKGGGHPYLTGLSIAGGMFWLGPEGVIMGPLLLCALFVALNMTTSILQESESEQLEEHVKHLSELSQLNQMRRSVL